MSPREFRQVDSTGPGTPGAFPSWFTQPDSPVLTDSEERARDQLRALNSAAATVREIARAGSDASGFNDYRSKRFDNPYNHLQNAHETIRSKGLQEAKGEYFSAI